MVQIDQETITEIADGISDQNKNDINSIMSATAFLSQSNDLGAAALVNIQSRFFMTLVLLDELNKNYLSKI